MSPVKQRSIWPVIIFAGLAMIVLLGLGVWQVKRLSEKEAMIAALDGRVAAAAISLAEALQRHDKGEDVEFLKVTVSGRLNSAEERYKIATNRGGAAWEVLTPMLTDQNEFLLLDRGLVPENYASAAPGQEAGAVNNLTAIIRLHHQGQGYFDPENDPVSNRWYWWDIPAMLASVTVPADATVAPFILQRLPQAGDGALPEVPLPKANLRNNHLGYAITWFGLALVTLAMAFAYVLSLRRTRKA
jgi:surfeit locus 1 family protein